MSAVESNRSSVSVVEKGPPKEKEEKRKSNRETMLIGRGKSSPLEGGIRSSEGGKIIK